MDFYINLFKQHPWTMTGLTFAAMAAGWGIVELGKLAGR